jgi:hypothetical protein
VNQQNNQRFNLCGIGEVRLPARSVSGQYILTCHLPYTHVSLRVVEQHSQFLENSVPPTLLATLITAQHARPFQPLPMLFPPILLFSSYLNLSNYKTDSAGITAAWSGLYALLAIRRSQVGPKPCHLCLRRQCADMAKGNQEQVHGERRRKRCILGTLCCEYRRLCSGVYLWQEGKRRQEGLRLFRARLVL